MNKSLRGLLCLVLLLGALGLGLVRPMAAAPAVPTESGVYTEDFVNYTYKDFTDDTEWEIWSGTLRLTRPDSADQFNPQVACVGQGSCYIVWVDRGNVNYDIYMQKMDRDGNRLWATDIRVNSDSGDAEQTQPVLGVDASGNAIVAWIDTHDNAVEIYAQRISPSGERLWATDVRVRQSTEVVELGTPALAVSGNAIIVVWVEWHTKGEIYAQQLNLEGNHLWVNDVRVSAETWPTSQRTPDVAMDAEGNAIVVWTYRSVLPYFDVYAQKISSAGAKLWDSDIIVNADPGLADHRAPAIAMVNDGAIIVWEDWRGTNADIYAQKIDATGGRVWANDSPVHTVAKPNHQTAPDIAIANSGEIMVTWEDNASYADIGFQRLNTQGTPVWPDGLLVNAAYILVGQTLPAIGIDDSGNAIVAWMDDRNSSRRDIYAQKMSTSGTRMWYGRDIRINYDTGRTVQKDPALIVDGDEIVLLWEDFRNLYGDIYAQRFDNNASRLWTADIRVNEIRARSEGAPYAVLDGDGNIVVVWPDIRNKDVDIYIQKLSSDGKRLWTADVRANSSDSSAYEWFPTATVDTAGNIFIFWNDYRNGKWDIYAQKLNPDGEKLWASDVQVSAPESIRTSFATAAADGLGNIVVAWANEQSEGWTIHAQKLSGAGQKMWGADVQVNVSGWSASNPHLVVSAAGESVVTWQDSRNGDVDIYAQRLSISGTRLWGSDVRANSDSGTRTQENPDVVLDAYGNAWIAWQGVRDDTWDRDIFLQRLNSAGSKSFSSDIQVNDTGNSYYGPTLDIDQQGNIFIAYEDYDNVYMQKLNAAGNRVWPSDIQAVYPDLFYLPQGSVQSKTVDTLDANLTAATLIANTQLNGGSVQFYLTNDGGATWFPVTPGVTHVFTTTGSDLRWQADLTVDPVWQHRSPIINSLRIEYSTQVPYADDYESDDTCTQAQPLAVNGATQAHAFHQQADEDWAWFDVISGTTYIVQTSNTQTNADTELELRAACPQPPFAGDDNVFGQDAHITWQATYSGTAYVKVSHHDPAVYGAETGYDLSVRTFTQPPVAVIVAGHDNSYSLQSNIDTMADMAYRTFLNSGVPKSNIRYFGPNPARDVDGNGLNDDLYATVTITGVRDAVQDWSREQGVQLGVPFYVYLVDHGHYDQFLAAGSANKVWAADLNLWLSNLEATSGADNINVILEACKSGSFIDVTTLGPAQVSGHNRVVIASTSSTLNAYPSPQGGYFSDVFWTAVGQNQDLKTAFEWAKQAVQATGLSQQPWLDDNGDAVADGQDGALARGRGLGGAFAGSPPVIDWAHVEAASGQATLQAQVRDDFGVEQVWAEVYAPDFVEPEPSQDGTTPEINVPTTTLTLVGSDLFSTTYPLTQTGNYRLVVYALDDEGNRALPQAVRVCVGCAFVYLPLVLRGN